MRILYSFTSMFVAFRRWGMFVVPPSGGAAKSA
jgi:hypothetical protein